MALSLAANGASALSWRTPWFMRNFWALWLAYDVGLTLQRRKTLGKSWAEIELVGTDGKAASVPRTVLRSVLKFSALAPLYWLEQPGWVGFAGVALDLLPPLAPRHLTLHDWVMGTRVIRGPEGSASMNASLRSDEGRRPPRHWTRPVVGVACWLGVAGAIGGGIGSLNLPAYFALRDRGVATTGTIVEMTPHVHNTVVAEYQVDGRTYRAQHQVDAPNPPISNLKAGDPIRVIYLPGQFATCVFSDAGDLLSNELVSVFAAAMFGSSMLVGPFLLRSRRTMARAKNDGG